MTTVRPFIWFNGRLREALDFYVGLFPDAEILGTSAVPDAGVPGAEPGDLMTATVAIGGQELTFYNGGAEYPQTPAFSLFITCADQAEVNHYWDAFADGGTPQQCGWITDRYGLTWQVVPEALMRLMGDPDPAKSAAVTQAMLGMVKLDVAGLEAAHASA